MKKGKKRAAFIAAGTAVITAAIVAGVSIYANASMKVESYKVSSGDIAQSVELNGTVASAKYQTLYSEADGQIAKVHVKTGDSVKKGDLLVSFDEERINYLIALAEYDAQASEGTYKNAIEQGNRVQALYNEAVRNLGVLNQQIADTEEALRVKQNELLEKQGALAKDGAGYQQSAIEKSDDAEEYKKYQQLVQKNAYEQQASPEVIAMQEEINRLTVQLTNFKEYKALMESQKAATDTSRLTAGQKEALEAQKAMAELTSKETIAKLEASKSGIVAQFDGIVTDIAVVEGCDIVRGMSLVTLASSEEIIVKCTVNKYDIQSIEEGQVTSSKIGNTDYTGKVTRIERITGSDAGSTPGVGVEITLDTPDEAIILGLDSKTKVSIAAVEGTMCIPKNAAVEEDGKTYVFVEKDKKAVRKEIETGVKNDDMIEVCSGLKEGEIVVWNEEVEMKDGMDIRVSR